MSVLPPFPLPENQEGSVLHVIQVLSWPLMLVFVCFLTRSVHVFTAVFCILSV